MEEQPKEKINEPLIPEVISTEKSKEGQMIEKPKEEQAVDFLTEIKTKTEENEFIMNRISKIRKDIGLKEELTETPPSVQKNESAINSTWKKYLEITGNPMLKKLMEEQRKYREAGIDTSELVGMGFNKKSIEKAEKTLEEMERVSPPQDRLKIGLEIFEDLKIGTKIGEFMPSGNIKKDAETFFSFIGDKNNLDRIKRGENPESLLKEFKLLLDITLKEAQKEPAVRKKAYSALVAIEVIDNILKSR